MAMSAMSNGAKFRLDHFRTGEYIYWDRTVCAHCFKDEAGVAIDITDFATYLTGWKEHKGN